MGWLGLKNGVLLQNLVKENFDVFISADKQLKHQQNLSKHNINNVVLKLIKNNFPNQILKIPDLVIVLNKIHTNKFRSEYFEI